MTLSLPLMTCFKGVKINRFYLFNYSSQDLTSLGTSHDLLWHSLPNLTFWTFYLSVMIFYDPLFTSHDLLDLLFISHDISWHSHFLSWPSRLSLYLSWPFLTSHDLSSLSPLLWWHTLTSTGLSFPLLYRLTLRSDGLKWPLSATTALYIASNALW